MCETEIKKTRLTNVCLTSVFVCRGGRGADSGEGIFVHVVTTDEKPSPYGKPYISSVPCYIPPLPYDPFLFPLCLITKPSCSICAAVCAICMFFFLFCFSSKALLLSCLFDCAVCAHVTVCAAHCGPVSTCSPRDTEQHISSSSRHKKTKVPCSSFASSAILLH